MKPEICFSIVIVNYNAGPYLEKCVQSVIASITIPVEIIIVDNRSDDGSLDFLAKLRSKIRIRLISPAKNVGFGAGCNLGAQHALGRWLHFLNPDTVVDSALARTYELLGERSPAQSIIVTELTDPNGVVVKSDFLLPTLGNYFLAMFDRRRCGRWYRGASVILSRETFQLLGGWSTYTLAYAEDIDLFLRAWRAAIPVERLNVAIMHAGEGCTGKLWDAIQRRVRIEHATREFYRQNGMHWQYYCVSIIQIVRNLVLLRKEGVLQCRALLATCLRPSAPAGALSD